MVAFLDPTLGPPKPKPPQPRPQPGAPLTGAAVTDPAAIQTGIPAPTAQAPPPTAPAPVPTPPPPSLPAPTAGPAVAQGRSLSSTPLTPSGGLDPNQALQQVSGAFQAKFGRPMTPEEQQALIQAVNFTGGQVTQAQLDQALSLVDQFTGDLANPFVTPPATTPTPAPQGIDPQQAAQTARTAFFQRFGRHPTPQEFQFLATASGFSGQGLVQQAELDAALDAIARYTGDIEEPFAVTNPTLEAALAALQPLLEIPFGEVDPNNPALRGQREAFERQTQRSAERRRASAAEIAAQEGTLGAGGFDIAADQILAEQGQENAAFEANLIAGELTQQRAALMQAIEIATQAGLTQQAQELQEQLGTLDIQLREFLGRGQLGLGLLGLTLQDQQFLESLGFNFAQLQNLMNSQAVNAILGR